MGHTSPERQLAKDLLADGEWHVYQDIMRQLVKSIAPGVAYRVALQIRRTGHNRALPGGTYVPVPIDMDRSILTGQKHLARLAIANHAGGRERFEQDKEKGLIRRIAAPPRAPVNRAPAVYRSPETMSAIASKGHETRKRRKEEKCQDK